MREASPMQRLSQRSRLPVLRDSLRKKHVNSCLDTQCLKMILYKSSVRILWKAGRCSVITSQKVNIPPISHLQSKRLPESRLATSSCYFPGRQYVQWVTARRVDQFTPPSQARCLPPVPRMRPCWASLLQEDASAPLSTSPTHFLDHWWALISILELKQHALHQGEQWYNQYPGLHSYTVVVE